ncbi:MAG: porin family protein [Oscillatoriophycideae cyanobacterium NC_groundwater_1537_Pr4_S-0.65um_50_18]|nr:porin family protein [Oscillatoriophycideae cyanobacterium NC_groundwater_1537_Pr4_S-0.65um_50_18]
MKVSLKTTVLSALSALIASPLLMVGAASAQTVAANGMSGSYIGGGASVGINNDASFGGNVQVRLNSSEAPVSVRGSALINGDSTAIMPTITYDAAIAPNTNLYVGGGYSFVTDKGARSPLGDKDAVVLTAGVETAVQRHVTLYSDVKVGLDAFENSNDAAVALQVGAAYRF